MALKRTRRSLSLNRGVYNQLQEKCTIIGASMSSMVEALVKDWLGKDSEVTVSAPPTRVTKRAPRANIFAVRPAVLPEVTARQQAAASAARSSSARQKAVELEKERVDREERAYQNPCREESCQIAILHEAHK